MKRRQFLKSVFGVIGGAVVLPSVVKAEPRGLMAADIAKIKKWFDEHSDTEARPADGKYLDVSEMTCYNCGRMIKIKKGFYQPGDCIECVCGNRAKFTFFAKVAGEAINNAYF